MTLGSETERFSAQSETETFPHFAETVTKVRLRPRRWDQHYNSGPHWRTEPFRLASGYFNLLNMLLLQQLNRYYNWNENPSEWISLGVPQLSTKWSSPAINTVSLSQTKLLQQLCKLLQQSRWSYRY